MIQLKELKQDVIIILDHQDNTVEIDRAKFEEFCDDRGQWFDGYWEYAREINDISFQIDMNDYIKYINLLSQEGLS